MILRAIDRAFHMVDARVQSLPFRPQNRWQALADRMCWRLARPVARLHCRWQRLRSERQTCGRRMAEPGPWVREENIDFWFQRPNGDRTCSFCGSLHPDDFECLVRCAAEPDSGVSIEPSDKRYKIYVRQPGVRNALEGGIKFYTHHAPPGRPDWLADCYGTAVQRSRQRSAFEAARRRAELERRWS